MLLFLFIVVSSVRTFLRFNHPLPNVQGDESRSVENDVDDGLEGVGAQSLRGGDEIARCIVHHDVGHAELVNGGVDCGFDGLRITDVTLEGQDGIAGLAGNLLGRGLEDG